VTTGTFHNVPFGEKVGSPHVATGTIGLNLRPLSGLPGPALLTPRSSLALLTQTRGLHIIL
jgi:hypothetical protein